MVTKSTVPSCRLDSGKHPFCIMMVTSLKYSPDWPVGFVYKKIKAHGLVYMMDFCPFLFICLITVFFS